MGGRVQKDPKPPPHRGQHIHVYPNDAQPEAMSPCTVSVRLRDISPPSDLDKDALIYIQRWQLILADCNPSASSKGCLMIAKIVVCPSDLCHCNGTEFCVVLHCQYSFGYIPERNTSNIYEVEFCFHCRGHAISIVCQLLPNVLLEHGTLPSSHF